MAYNNNANDPPDAPPVPARFVLGRYIIRQLSKSIFLAVLVVSLILLPGFAFRMSVSFENYGIGAATAFWIVPALIPQVLMIALPLGAMIGSILVFSRMQAMGEIVAIRAGGGATKRFILPTLIFGLALGGLFFLLCGKALSWSAAYVDTVVRSRTCRIVSSQLVPGHSYQIRQDNTGGQQVILLTLLPETDSGEKPLNISVFQVKPGAKRSSPNRNSLEHSIVARDHDLTIHTGESGLPESMLLSLKDVTETFRVSNPPGMVKLTFGDKTIPYTFGYDVLRKARNPMGRSMRSFFVNLENIRLQRAKLLDMAGSDPTRIAKQEKNVRKEQVEASRKIATVVSIPILMLMGIGFGLMVSKSSPFVGFLSGIIGFGMLYYPLLNFGMQLGMSDRVNPWVGPWLVNLVLLPLSIWLIRRRLVVTGRGIGTIIREWAVMFRQTRRKNEKVSRGVANTESAADANRPGTIRPAMKRIPGVGVATHHAIGSFLIPFIGTYIGMALIFIGGDLVDSFDQIISYFNDPELTSGFGSRLAVVMQYYLYNSTSYLLEFAVITILIGVVFGMLVAQRTGELIIIRSGGRSLQRAYAPVIFCATLIAAGVYSVKESVWPGMLRKRDNLFRIVRGRPPEMDDNFSVVSTQGGRMQVMTMARFNGDTHRITDLVAYEFIENNAAHVTRIRAETAVWSGTRWEFPSGGTKETLAQTAVTDHTFTETYAVKPISTYNFQVTPAWIRYKRWGASRLTLPEIRRLPKTPALKAEFHHRVSEFFITPIVLMLCLPFLVRTEDSSALGGVGKTILLAAVFLIGRALVRALAGMTSQPLMPMIMVWGFTGLIGVIAVLLFWKRLPT